ncbi:MAG TPA: S1 RNA-binding domain-containing protein [Limnochordia bacterium]|nr:S1 RNA-binding domain-containing protein [Limnochordia bacterium]
MPVEVGQVVEGKVTGITHFGAFVQLADGQTGLVHISEVADAYVRDIKDHLKEQDTIKVKVINVSGGKIGLSIKQVNTDGVVARPARPPRRERGSFDSKLNAFLKDSDERLAGLRRNQDAKRGGRGTRRDS